MQLWLAYLAGFFSSAFVKAVSLRFFPLFFAWQMTIWISRRFILWTSLPSLIKNNFVLFTNIQQRPDTRYHCEDTSSFGSFRILENPDTIEEVRVSKKSWGQLFILRFMREKIFRGEKSWLTKMGNRCVRQFWNRTCLTSIMKLFANSERRDEMESRWGC